MTPLSEDLHKVLLAVRFESVPDENDITVRGILEKSQTTSATESRGFPAMSARSHRHSSRKCNMKGWQERRNHKTLFTRGHLDLISFVVRMNGGTLR